MDVRGTNDQGQQRDNGIVGVWSIFRPINVSVAARLSPKNGPDPFAALDQTLGEHCKPLSTTARHGTVIGVLQMARPRREFRPRNIRMRTTFSLLSGLLLAIVTQSFARAADGPLPADWLAGWNDPPAADRPLQIIHGIDPARVVPEGIQQMLHDDSASRRLRRKGWATTRTAAWAAWSATWRSRTTCSRRSTGRR